MTIMQTESILQLPLSWARISTANPAFKLVKLPFNATNWIPTAEVPQSYSFDQLYQSHLSQLPNGFVLQSCGLPVRDYLIEQGCQVAAMGAEAVLELPWRGKRSVRELARRGRRHGTVQEIPLNQTHQHKLAQLIDNSPARQGVQLRHTERTEFDESTRCFVFETKEKVWMGAITLSTVVAPTYFHTELLLRHKDAQVGVMEALVTAIARQLAQEGGERLSLGNVTPLPETESEAIFAPHRHPQELWTQSQLSFQVGRSLNFAYNSEGLWRFKNKFISRWEPLYLCASPRLSWATMAGLLHAMGYVNLVWSQVRDSLTSALPTFKPQFPTPSGHCVLGLKFIRSMMTAK
ncbi:phosphatidylglycerol lysyltransferase domain-containing protein [Anaerolineales bacterium HSG6]|nr:phosphatidylglycerol lysyltransferase domain-containing protein [Anaerolineales bacterium HSG6]MDM8529568.1 phosphatidylglycerol lysyltransferase domain-containing protein [Anaerolineales bacterium HSG25]